MKKIIFLLISLFAISAQAQQSFIEKYNLPLYDCERRGFKNIEKLDLVIVVPDDSAGVSMYVTWMETYYKEQKQMIVSLKTESELNDKDYENTLWIQGPIDRFSDWDKFEVPITKVNKGFKIGNYEFTDSLNSFSYMTDSITTPLRIVVSGNSLEAFSQIRNMSSFGLGYVVLHNVVPSHIGNSPDLTDLDAIRKEHYIVKESKYYTFMISKMLGEKQLSTSNEQLAKYDNHAETFVKKMELDVPQKKILTYIHADQHEIKYICGFYDAICDGTVHGFVTGDEIHSWGFGGAIEHESNHHLFNQINKRPPTFLSEGIQKWYEYSNNNDLKQKGILKAKEFVSEDLNDMICGKGQFFQGDKYYLISGIFVDYLLGKYGLGKFKEVYKYETGTIAIGFEKTYNKPLQTILEEYKEWLLKLE